MCGGTRIALTSVNAIAAIFQSKATRNHVREFVVDTARVCR